MSRSLKFRAWGKNSHEYLGEGEGFNIDEMSWIKGQLDKWELEQYTGLKDTQGLEIYEGDIVTLVGEWEELEPDDCKAITYRDGCFRVGDDYENEAGSYLSDWRVVGNIHDKNAIMKLKGQE